jgi:MraZ protein
VWEQLGEPRIHTVFVTAGPDACLWIYSPAGLERLANQLEQAPTHKPQAQVFQRLYFAHTEPISVDRNGWIVIPEHLARFAALGHDVVLIGVRDHFEVWDVQRWQQYLEQNAPATKHKRKGHAVSDDNAE